VGSILLFAPMVGASCPMEGAHLYDAGISHLGYNFKPLWDSMGEAAFQSSAIHLPKYR
jgi:hypothetical protein